MEDEITCTVALLHDIVEDTSITMDDLRDQFPPEVIDALTLLTHDDTTEYFTHVKAIKSNPLALKVKQTDLAHNSDQSQCVGCDIPAEKLDAWKVKYEKATKILTED